MARYASFLRAGTNNFQTTAEHTNNFVTDFLADGVVGTLTNTAGVAPMTGNFAVNAQGTPDNTVAVSIGKAYVTVTPGSQASQRIRVYSTASENVTISANATGGTRFDWLYINVNATNADNPNTAGDNVWTLTTSRSTSSSTDNGTPPTYGYCIAVITVANGFSTITNGNIADKRVQAGSIARLLTPGTSISGISNPYKFSAWRSSNIALATNTWSKITADTKEYDTGSNYDNVTNFRFIAPVAGFYQFSAACVLNSGASAGLIAIAIYKGGLEFKRGVEMTGNSVESRVMVAPPPISLAANDYIEAFVFVQNASVTALSGQNNTYFGGYLVSTT